MVGASRPAGEGGLEVRFTSRLFRRSYRRIVPPGGAGAGEWMVAVYAVRAFVLGPVIGAALYAACPLPVVLLE